MTSPPALIQKKKRNIPVRIIQLLGTIILFYVLFRRFNLQSCLDILLRIKYHLFIMGFLCHFLGNGLYALSWHMILRNLGTHPSFLPTLSLFFQGIFINNFATFLGGDIFRGVKMAGKIPQKFNIGFSILISRIVLLFTLIWFASAATIIWGHSLSPDRWLAILGWGIFIVCLFTFIFLYRVQKIPFMSNRFSPRSKIGGFVTRLDSAFKVFLEDGRHLFVLNLVNILGHLLGFVATWLLARGLGIPIHFWQVILFESIIRLLLILPITVNGLGLREVGFVSILSLLGFNELSALSLGLISSVSIIMLSMLGGILILWDSLVSRGNGV